MEIRPLDSWEEYRAAESLQAEVWGEDLDEIAPAGLMKVTRRVGGVASGAFDDRGELVGFVYGITGLDDGRPVHWSHMLGVATAHRDRGLGLRLKEHQRELLLERGVDTVRWTFDPLVARNAHFNLNRLRVRVVDYVPDMYGSSGSRLHQGLGTDRFVVVWDLEAYDPDRAGRGDGGGARRGRAEVEPGGRGPSPGAAGAEGGLRPGAPRDAAGEEPSEGRAAAPPVVRVEVPADVLAVRDRDPEAAAAWRKHTRRAFLARLEAGYRISGFVPGSDRGFYVLLHPEVDDGQGGSGG